MARIEPTISNNKYPLHHDRRDMSITPGEVIKTTLLNRVSWGAVSAGVVIALAVQLVLNLFGTGIGLAAMDSVSGPGVSAMEFSWAGAIWWTVSGVIAAFVGGFTAGRLAGEPEESTAGWHGVTAWAASVLLIAVLMTTAAGAVLQIGSPYQIILDQEIATLALQDTAPTNTYDSATGSTMTPDTALLAPETTSKVTTTTPAVDMDVAATAALISALALFLGALTAWFGGCAGTVMSPAEYERRNSTTH
jgi:hypothetical protein